MIIESPRKKKIQSEYDFLLSNGMLLPLTLKEGDEIGFEADLVRIKMSARQSLSDPDVMHPEEEILIYKSHILSVSHRQREVEDIVQSEWADLLKSTGQTLQ